MKFNLLETGYVTASGTVPFDVESMADILSISGTVTISGVNDDSFWICGDIVDRIGTYQIRYYFDSSTSSGTVASGISFYYKNDEADSYSSLITNIGSGYYYTTVPGQAAPRHIKLTHTVSGTAVDGIIVGLEVLNDDSVVNFGADGTLTSSTTLTSLSYLNYNDYIKEIEIYNNGSSVANAHVFIDPQHNDADELLSISASEDGPWVFSRNTDYIISNGNNWDAGQYDNTSTSGIADGKLRLNPGYTVGTYTTPIFKNETVKYAYIDMLSTSVSGAIVAADNEDYTSTIQIRSSNSKPWDYDVYRIIQFPINTNQFWYKDYLLTTDVEVYDSYDSTATYFGEPRTPSGGSYNYTFDTTQFTIDKNTQKTVFIFSGYRNYYCYFGCSTYYVIDLYLLSQEGVQLEKLFLANIAFVAEDNPYHHIDVYCMKFDNNGGIWLYLYLSISCGDGYQITSAGYYLLHLDSDLSVTYNSGAQSSDFISGYCTPVAGSTSVWYCAQGGTVAVIKLSAIGTIEFSYEDVIDLKGLCSTDDGSCWFIDDDKLYKLNSSGILVDSIINLEINFELTFVEFDSEDMDFLWIVDGVYVKRIRLDGSIFSSIYLEGFTINRLLSTSGGLWVYCTEGITGDKYAKYIGKLSAGVEKTIECVSGGGGGKPSDIGIKNLCYDNPILGNLIPLPSDPVWNDALEWNKTVTNNAILPREEYNQLKLILRRPSVDIDSPTIENIYYQDNVEITNIPPGQSKTLYLRLSLPDGVTIGGNYESNLRVWWELPVV